MTQKHSLREPDEYEAEYMGGESEIIHREKMTFPKPFLWLIGLLLTFAVTAQIYGIVASGAALTTVLLPLLALGFAAMLFATMATARGHEVPAHIMPDENELNMDAEVVFSGFEEATQSVESTEAVESIHSLRGKRR